MTASRILQEVAEAIGSQKTKKPLSAFVFGSSLNPEVAWSDIDILVVYACEADAASIKIALAYLCEQFPIHLTILMEEEETELKFIASQQCRWLASTSIA